MKKLFAIHLLLQNQMAYKVEFQCAFVTIKGAAGGQKRSVAAAAILFVWLIQSPKRG
jgi:hypothetical protein